MLKNPSSIDFEKYILTVFRKVVKHYIISLEKKYKITIKNIKLSELDIEIKQ